MGYKAGDYSKGQVIDPDSCPQFERFGRTVENALIGYEIGKMTVRRTGIGAFFREVKRVWDEPDPKKRAAENRRRRR